MANTVYSDFNFYGNDAVMAKIAEWENKLKPIEKSLNSSEQRSKLQEVFYEGYDGAVDFGSKWVEYKGGFVFESAWSPPEYLQDRILTLLASIDEKVIVQNEYNIEDGTYGYRFIMLDEDGDINADVSGEVAGSELTYDDEGDDDNEENHNLSVEYYEDKISYLGGIMSQKKWCKKYLTDELKTCKKELRELKKRKF